VRGRFVASTVKAVSLALTFQHSSDGTSWDNFSTATNASKAFGSTGATGAQAVEDAMEQPVSLVGARRYMRQVMVADVHERDVGGLARLPGHRDARRGLTRTRTPRSRCQRARQGSAPVTPWGAGVVHHETAPRPLAREFAGGGRLRKVAIVGFADSYALAPFDDAGVEIWGINELHRYLPRWTGGSSCTAARRSRSRATATRKPT
jgi:hypothetical protein